MIRINMKQMHLWCVTSDNVRLYDIIMRTRGEFFTLDARPYVDWLCQFNIFYTLSA